MSHSLDRRQFLKGAALAPALLQAAPTTKMVGIQIGAVSFLDEGTEKVLDILQERGGVNTLFYTLSNSGMSVVPRDRSPDGVCQSIEEHRVELLPTSPTFLNLLLLSSASTRYDISSLRLVTYGTEPMPERTLARLSAAFPHGELLQTYGSTEFGILRSKSRGRDSSVLTKLT